MLHVQARSNIHFTITVQVCGETTSERQAAAYPSGHFPRGVEKINLRSLVLHDFYAWGPAFISPEPLFFPSRICVFFFSVLFNTVFWQERWLTRLFLSRWWSKELPRGCCSRSSPPWLLEQVLLFTRMRVHPLKREWRICWVEWQSKIRWLNWCKVFFQLSTGIFVWMAHQFFSRRYHQLDEPDIRRIQLYRASYEHGNEGRQLLWY